MPQNRIDLIRPDAPLLASFGPHAVGVTTLDLVNPDQIDVVTATPDFVTRTDRSLVVEVWYPAADDTAPGGSYATLLRDGVTPVTLRGRAARNAAPLQGQRHPLVILSHGYPGNRYLMSHLGENLASKGYVVASIDHTDSTYDNPAVFGSTLVNRPWDMRFVLGELAELEGDLGAIINADTTAVIGYSMGGYGALVVAGAGVTRAAPSFAGAPPQGLLARNVAGTDSHAALMDERVKAVVAIGPWGRNADLWDAAGLAAISTPLMLIAGSLDDVSMYPSIRAIFSETTGTTRHLLTFQNANHNAAAPIPAPVESWTYSATLGRVSFDHYSDPVWDSVRMNNIGAHFVTAFLDYHLKADDAKAGFLNVVPNGVDGIAALDDTGEPTKGHTYWKGFAPRTASGLRFETLPAGKPFSVSAAPN